MVAAPAGVSYCAIEGNSGSGKTSTAEALSRAWGQPGFVGEYFGYFEPPALVMPDLPPPDPVVARAQSSVWAAIDRSRYADLRGLAGGAYPVVLDTTVLSVLACEMAKREAGEASAAAEITAQYRRLLDEGTVWPPEFWVFLETSHGELERRIAERGGSRPFLRRPDVARYLETFRISFAKRYLDAGEFLRLPNDTTPVGDIVSAVTMHAVARHDGGSGFPVARTGLRRFLDDLARDDVTVR